jgi:hypothetical protein
MWGAGVTGHAVPSVVVPLRARENVRSKAARYLLEGRLTIVHVDGDLVSARCAGQGSHYELGHDHGRGWFCSCPSVRSCSHLTALQTLVRLP